MSSVAVLTQESFNEHRSGLLPEQVKGKWWFWPFCDVCNHSPAKLTLSVVPLFPLAAVAGSSGAEDEDSLPTYKDAFPPLPEKPLPEGVQETGNAWTSKLKPLKSSIITQVRRSS